MLKINKIKSTFIPNRTQNRQSSPNCYTSNLIFNFTLLIYLTKTYSINKSLQEMGGHGGLNILPQKKWNVYNYDNRDIVEKDKKIAADNARKKREKDRQQMLTKKMEVLKGEEQEQGNNQQQQPKYHSLITKQLHNLQDGKKHVNLFEKQEQILLNRDILQIKRLQQAEFLKDKNMDYSSRFLGTYNDQKTKPWYLKKNKVEAIQNKKNASRSNLSDGITLEMRQFQSINNQYHQENPSNIYAPQEYISDRYNQIKQKSKNHRRNSSRSDSSQSYDRSREKHYRKKQHKYNKLPIKSEMKLKQEIKQTPIIQRTELNQHNIKCEAKPQNDMEILREKRLKRQQRERLKIMQLKAKIQNNQNP